MKRIVFLLPLSMIAGALQAQSFDVGHLSYSITSRVEPYTVEVTRSTTKLSDNIVTSVTIPETVDNEGRSYMVTSIGESAFTNCYMLGTVVIPNTVKTIGSYAFSGCSGLRTLNIPNSVTSIGVAAFFNCKNLNCIIIPSSVKTIENGAFNNENTVFFCESESRPLGWTSSGSTYWNNRKGTVIWNSFVDGDFGYQRTSPYTVSFMKILRYKESVTIPMIARFAGVTYMVNDISDNAFAGNADISEIIIPVTVSRIGKSVFSGCTELTSITIPNSVTTIADNAFAGCTSLTSVEIPNSVTNIGSNAFSACTSLKSIEIPNSVKTIGDNAFAGCISLTSISIPSSVEGFGNGAFSGCTSLTSIEISNSVKTISDNAFAGCTSLTAVNIPGSVDGIGNGAFSGCTSLNNVTMSNSVKSIGKKAFSGCAELRSVAIPNSAKSIGSFAFSDCGKLTVVLIPKSVATIGNNVFGNDNTDFYCESLGVPSGWSNDKANNKIWNGGKGTIHWEISFIADSIAYFVTSANTVSARHYLGGGGLLKIPSSVMNGGVEYAVTDIGKFAFYGCKSITKVAIPKSVVSVGEKAFAGCDNIGAVYCGIPGKPVGWAGDCFPDQCNVVWGKDL